MDYNFCSDVACFSKLYYFEQRIFNYRIRKTCRNIRNRGTFFLRLLYAAVHKHRAAASKVYGFIRKQCNLTEFAYIHSHRARKIFKKTSAAGGTSFIKLNGDNGTVFDLKALHVLSAYIKQEFYSRHKKICGSKMCNRFNFAGINAQCSLK